MKNTPTTKTGNEGATTSSQNNTAHRATPPSALTEQRALAALKAAQGRGVTRKDLDAACGTSNSPEAVRKLRARGYDITTTRESAYNRFGEVVVMGVYRLVGGPKND